MSNSCRVCGSPVDTFHSFPKISLLNKPVERPLPETSARMDLSYCGRCRHISSYLESTQDIEALMKKIYLELYETMSTTTLSPSQEKFTLHMGTWLAEIAKGSKKKILEIGSHDGFLLNCLKQQGHDVIGVEPSPFAKSSSEKYGIEVRQDFFTDGMFSEKSFDLIIARHVVEHVPAPTEFVKSIARCLKPNGMLYIEVPNSLGSLAACFFPEFHADHISYFTPSSLIWMLREVGLGDFSHFESFDAYMSFPFMGALVKPGKSDGPEYGFAIQNYKIPDYLARFSNNFKTYQTNLSQLSSDNSVGVWGAGSIGNRFAIDGNFQEAKKYFDINPLNVGKRLSITGNKVYSATQIPEMGIQKILLATGWENDASKQLRTAAGPHIRSIRFSELLSA
ncbi:MAG: class I SAM-dependent methyltransferase [Deltaproteobacteria bacterium]|nr:class I SAM-dependent methyltransferase [Deltaproteobacteria bacterium]